MYSRNSEDNTTKYPDIVASIPKLVKPGVRGLVLDCEAVAYDRTLGKLLPFQVGWLVSSLARCPGCPCAARGGAAHRF